MTNLLNYFDRDEMIRVTREGIENSLRFYMTLNENIVKMTDLQKDAINETTKKSLESLNRSYEEYQKNHRIITSRVESFYRDMVEKAAPKKEKTQEK
ncbi:MAG: hypothetical protein HQM10_09820 [Candidatus Riflebacteria bacterium]|nr:hypothetical protein [Candidatus Riflebacteria bacterium]